MKINTIPTILFSAGFLAAGTTAICHGQTLQNTLSSIPLAAATTPNANLSGKTKRPQATATPNAADQLRAMGITPDQYNEAICNAADSSDNEKLALLIAAGADVNAYASSDGYTPLTNVCVYCNTEGLRMLLAAPGIQVNQPNRNGDTAIIFAAIRGNEDCVNLLIAAGSDVNFIDSDNKTALDWATENDNDSVANILRAAGGKSVNELNGATGNTSRPTATGRATQPTSTSNAEAVARLRENGITPDMYSQALCDATDNQNTSLIGDLIAAGADVNVRGRDGWTPLTNCCLYENLDGVRLLLAAPGIDVNFPNADGDTPLQIATTKRNNRIISMLRQAGADSNAGSSTSDSATATPSLGLGEGSAQDELRAKGITPDEYNQAICDATDRKDNATLRLLILAGADVNATGADGWTPLTNCCLYENEEGVRILLAAPGIDITKTNSAGRTPLQIATGNGNREILRMLNSAGANAAPDNTPAQAGNRAAQNQLREMGITPSDYSQAICDATDSRNNERLRLLIAAGADVNATGSDGWTPLTNCCLYENVEGVRLLLAAPGIDVNKTTRSGKTPLQIATEKANREIVRMLNSAGANAAPDNTPAPAGDRAAQNQLRERGITPSNYNQAICNATDNSNNEVLRLLIAAGADVNATGSDGWTPLTNCCLYENVEGVRLLLAAPGIDVNKTTRSGKTPLQIASEKANREIVRMLNRAGANAAPDNTPAPAGDRAAQNQLRERGITPSNYNQAICNATDNSNNELLRLLIAAGADVNATGADGWTPLTNCCLYENEEGVRLLLAAPGIDITKTNSAGKTPLQIANEQTNRAIVRMLNNARPNTASGRTTARSNNSAQAQLRERGITPNNYNQAICDATDNKDNELLRLLIAAGADVNATGSDGWTPLTNSCMYENEEGVRLLLAAPGINVNKPNRTGDTAIIWAAVKGNATCLRMLMNAPGIDINFIDSDGKTALEWAEYNEHSECARMLRQAGAKTAAQVRNRRRR